MKYLIFDAGPIISLSMAGILPVLEKLKKEFSGEFILTPSVKEELIDRPIKIKKYKLEALKVKNLISNGVFKMSNEFIPRSKLETETKNILKKVNGFLRTSKTGEKITILHKGEASCLAFSKLCKCENVIVVDERTTRLLTEAPESLEKLMEKKLHMELDSTNSLIKDLQNMKFIRSSELLFVAYKKGLFEIEKNKDLLDALLYALKYNGTAISDQEIEEMKRLG